MKRFCTFFFILFCTVQAIAQTAHSDLRTADKWYNRSEYNRAEEHYRRAQPTQPDQATYNLGNALYQQKRYDEAIKQYEALAQKPNLAPQLQSQNQHNLGNSYMQKKDYQKAIESYQKALKLQPKDAATRRNLALAMRQKQEQEKQKQQSPKQQSDKKDDKKDDKSQQQNQKNDPKNEQPPNQDGKQKQPQSGDKPQDLKKDEVRKMLQIMDDEERKVQQRLQKGKPTESVKKGKDW